MDSQPVKIHVVLEGHSEQSSRAGLEFASWLGNTTLSGKSKTISLLTFTRLLCITFQTCITTYFTKDILTITILDNYSVSYQV